MNAAMGIIAAGKTEAWWEAADLAATSIDSGAAQQALDTLRSESNTLP